MAIEIEAPDGSIVEFPDGTPDATIEAAMGRAYPSGPVSPFGMSSPMEPVPQAFLDRMAKGKMIDRVIGSMVEGAQAKWGEEPLGFRPGGESEKFFEETGIFSGPNRPLTPLRLFNEATLRPLGAGLDAMFRVFAAGSGAVGGLVGAFVEEVGGSSGDANRARRGVADLVDIAGLVAGANVSRVRPGKLDRLVEEENIGGLPQARDFVAAETMISEGARNPQVEAKLKRLWREEGIHPAEVVADMADMPDVAAAMKSASDHLPEYYVGSGRALEPPAGAPPAKPPEPPVPAAPEPPAGSGRGPDGRMTLEEANRRTDAMLSVGEQPAERNLTWHRAYSATVDSLFEIEKVSAKPERGGAMPADNAYVLSRLTRGWAGKAGNFIEEGPRDFYTYETVGPSLKAILEPLKGNLAQFRRFVTNARAAELERRGITSGFDMEAARVVVEAGKKEFGPHMLRLVEFQNQVAAYYRDAGMLSKEGYKSMLEANKLFVPFHRVMEATGDAAGGVSKTLQAQQMVFRVKGSDLRVVDPIENIIRNTYLLTAMAEKNVAATKLIDGLALSIAKAESAAGKDTPRSKEITILPDTGGEISQAVYKRLKEEGIDATKDQQLADVLARGTEQLRDGEVRVWRDGQAFTYQVGHDLARAVKDLDASTMGLLERWLSPLASYLRAGALAQPEFWLRHLVREPIAGVMTYKHGAYTPVDMVKGLVGVIVKDKDYHNWVAGGGAHVSLVALDRNYLQLDLAKYTEHAGLMTRAWNVVLDPSSPMWKRGTALPAATLGKYVLHPLQAATEAVTSATHLGAFKKRMRQLEREAAAQGYPGTELVVRDGVDMGTAMKAAEEARVAKDSAEKKRILDAAWVSRDTSMDNARIGAQTRGLNAINAFLNARIQDLDVLGRQMIERPVTTAATITGGIIVPSILTWLNGKDDPRYQNAPAWQRDMFWVVPLDRWNEATVREVQGLPGYLVRKVGDRYFRNDGAVLRIPKPFLPGVLFGSGTERTLDAFFKDKPDSFRNFQTTLGESAIGELAPTALVPVIEQARNRSMLSGQALIPKPLENGLPEYQFTPYTTETAKAIGRVMSAFPGISEARLPGSGAGPYASGAAQAVTSPIMIEHYIRGWTGTLGQFVLKAADYGLRKAGAVPDPPNRPTATLADIPVVRAFIARYPTMGAQPIQDFYDDAAKAEAFYSSFMQRAKAGDIEALERIQALSNNTMFQRMAGLKSAMGNIASAIRMIDRNPEIESHEKRQLIDSMYYSMIQLADDGKTTARALDRYLHDEQGTRPPLQ